MGVFTVGRQVALEIDMPGWWLANASVDMDFRNGSYYDSTTYPQSASALLSCTRASVGYAKNSDGTLTQFASNALRIGNGMGLLVEAAQTNICLQSEDASTTWSPTAITVTTNQAVAPNGTTTMDQLFDGVAGGRHIIEQSFTISAGAIHTVSFFVKNVDRRYVQIVMANSGRIHAIADLQTGTITDSGVQSGAAGTVFTSASIEAFSSGIYRIALTGSADNTTGLFLDIALSDVAVLGTNVFGSPSYTGSNKSVYVWGMQVEQATFASSYTPTTTVAVTRAADNIITSGALQSTINAATGSLVAQVDNGLIAGVAANIVDSNGTNLLGFDASNHGLASMTATLATANTANRTAQDKLGLAWTASARSLAVNGGTVASDASSQTPSSTQHVGSSGSANFANAYIERLTAFNTKLADATLQGFTV